jgi:quercetin dioxygenase-like cupin family protein
MNDERRFVMKLPPIAAALSLFACGVIVGVAIPVLGGDPATPKITNLFTTALSPEFTPDREVLVDVVEFPPNSKVEWHWHPGEEFHYYLEGDAVIERRNAPDILGKPGTVGHIEFKQVHQAIAGDKGAKILVFRVHEKGAPVRYSEGEDAKKKEGK